MSEYENRLRVRVMGVLVEMQQGKPKMLLLRLAPFGEMGEFWLPPGGGVQFGEPMQVALQREFEEETGLQVRPTEFLTCHEFISEKYHAVELLWRVERVGGQIRRGYDPERAPTEQLIQNFAWFSYQALQALPLPKRYPLLDQEQFWKI